MDLTLFATLTLCRNCEDIAMSFLVANATGAPPIWVQGQCAPLRTSSVLMHHLTRNSDALIYQFVHFLH
jgi:hypothetical protein